jgi:hypothetical protein
VKIASIRILLAVASNKNYEILKWMSREHFWTNSFKKKLHGALGRICIE